MRRVERLGVELAYALRMRNERRSAYEKADQEVRRLEETILAADGRELDADTASHPVVPDDRPTERFDGPEFEQCPGQTCSAWRQGQDHAHLGGRIWASSNTS